MRIMIIVRTMFLYQTKAEAIRPMIIVRTMFLNPTKAGAKGDCRKIRGTDGTLQMPGFDEQEVRILGISDAQDA